MVNFKKLRLQSGDKKNKNVLAIRITGLILFLIIFLIYFGYKNQFLKIKEVELKNKLDCVDEEQFLKETKIVGQNLFILDEEGIINKIKEKFGCVDFIVIKKKYPKEVEVEFIPRIPVSVFGLIQKQKKLDLDLIEATDSTKAAEETKLDFSVDQNKIADYFLTDKKGLMYSQVNLDKVENLPIFYNLVDNVLTNRSIDQEYLKNLLTISSKLKQQLTMVKSFKVDEDKLLVDGETKIVFSLSKDPLRQSASLQLILQKAKINSALIDLVDLRFEKPVVVYLKNR